MKKLRSALRRTAAEAASAPLTLIVAMLASLFVPTPAAAQPRCAQPAAIVRTIDNDVRVVLASTTAPVRATRDMPVCAGDRIEVSARSSALVFITASNSVLRLDQNSVVELPTANAARPYVSLLQGALLFITRLRRSFEVRTPFVNASVEGTEFVVRVGLDRATVTVLEGRVRATRGAESVDLIAGEQAVAVTGQPLEKSVVVRPRDAVQWALYYEPIVPADTFARLDAVPAANQDAAFFVRRAGLLLGVGQLEAARADLDQAGKLDAANGDVYALRAITAVALNDQAQALQNGRRAVELAPGSIAARLALSYALQANFQLEEARTVISQTVMSTPNDAAAWARLAELRLMLDDVGGAVDASERAVMLAPESGRPRVVLGFTQLARLKFGDAERTFEQALGLQSNDPLAHFGHGLTQIRRGKLGAGRSDLETAVALNPENAILRSYLGKAYFDERRDTLAGQQFASAKAIDPLDPTAWYYDAIRLQTINRPVEAVRGQQQAIRLNDNRAVYRSSFLLDEDLAARQAGLGRAYGDLGLDEVALAEGWKSVQTDPADHSGHRFLSDAYSALPRHEVARVSELLQSQLLQPINLTPVPPRLAATDLFILEGTGPDRQAFNEFNPLFNRNRLAVQLSGVTGQNSIVGDEVTVAGVWNRLSFSLGQFHYDTDGFRLNNYQDRDLQNAFVQLQLFESTSIQGEVRTEHRRFGDLTLLFSPTDFSQNELTRSNSKTVRVGFRHTFSARSVLIGSVQRADVEVLQADSVTNAVTRITTQSRVSNEIGNWTAELRHLFRVGPFAISSGAGQFEGNTDLVQTTNITLPFPPFRLDTTSPSRRVGRQTNVYLYPAIELPYHVTITAGASADFYRSGLVRRSQVNPKIGLSWNPIPSTTIRLASIETLQRSLVGSQTIEPTQVSGFNQFFEETGGTEARRQGLAIDQKLGRDAFVGAEYSWRRLAFPTTLNLPTGTQVRYFERKEQQGRAYASWLPHARWSVNAKYLFQRFDRETDGREHFSKLRTHRVPLEIRYFAPEGLFATLTTTRIFQSGLFGLSATTLKPGEDRFWVVDAAVGFRLPRRIGRISLDAKNLFDEQFNFQDTDPRNPLVRPGRVVALSFTLGI